MFGITYFPGQVPKNQSWSKSWEVGVFGNLNVFYRGLVFVSMALTGFGVGYCHCFISSPWYCRFLGEFDGVGFATKGYKAVSFTLYSRVCFLGNDESML